MPCLPPPPHTHTHPFLPLIFIGSFFTFWNPFPLSPTYFPFWDLENWGDVPLHHVCFSSMKMCFFFASFVDTSVDLVNSLARIHVCFFYSTLRIWIRLLFSENACRSFFDVFQCAYKAYIHFTYSFAYMPI